MVIRAEEMEIQHVTSLRGGDGTLEKRIIAPGDANVHQRLLGRFTIPKGCSIGNHQHLGETEYYYILKGEGILCEDGKETVMRPGDVSVTGYGSSHSIRNVKDEDLEFIAVIVTEK